MLFPTLRSRGDDAWDCCVAGLVSYHADVGDAWRVSLPSSLWLRRPGVRLIQKEVQHDAWQIIRPPLVDKQCSDRPERLQAVRGGAA